MSVTAQAIACSNDAVPRDKVLRVMMLSSEKKHVDCLLGLAEKLAVALVDKT